MNSKDLAIGVLSTTAVILFVGLILLNAQPVPVYASGMGDRGGDYIMLSGQLWEQEEVIYVIDAGMSRMIGHKYANTKKQITVGGAQDLETFLKGQSSPGGRRGRRP